MTWYRSRLGKQAQDAGSYRETDAQSIGRLVPCRAKDYEGGGLYGGKEWIGGCMDG